MRDYHFNIKVWNYEFLLASLVALFLSLNYIISKIFRCLCIKNIYELGIFEFLNEYLCWHLLYSHSPYQSHNAAHGQTFCPKYKQITFRISSQTYGMYYIVKIIIRKYRKLRIISKIDGMFPFPVLSSEYLQRHME